ncbi:hypothetical protein F2981_02610 [Sinorhizobium meliloti]|nr:hypothetical protein [Sinorhizobium meliloti]
MRPLEDAGYEVRLRISSIGALPRHAQLQQVGDSCFPSLGGSVGVDIVTNPPYADWRTLSGSCAARAQAAQDGRCCSTGISRPF